MTIGDRIKARRQELGLSVEELAEKLGKNRATVYRYENGDIKEMPTPVLEPLAKALQTTPAELMGWSVDAVRFAKTADIINQRIVLASEKKHLEMYRKLTEENRNKIDKMTATLLDLQAQEDEILLAAHERTDADETASAKDHDMQIMDEF